MFTINKTDKHLLQPGMRVVISSELKGVELYGGEDPEGTARWCGEEVTILEVAKSGDFPVGIAEDPDAWFCMEEIEYIVEDEEIEESDESLTNLFRGVI